MFFRAFIGLECCHLNKADFQSLDFTSNRLFMKLFRTGSIDVVQERRSYFRVELPSCLIKKNKISCFVDIVVSCDLLCCCAAN